VILPATRVRAAPALAVLLAAAASQLQGAAVSGAQPGARLASACHISPMEGQSLGPTYVTYLGVSGGASCTQGRRLVRSYYQCRVRHGGVSGHCSGVEGFRCSEHRFAVIKVQYDASVTCTRGHETVRHNYTQFT